MLRTLGRIRQLFANDCAAQPGQMPTAGFTKRYDGNGDGTAGRVVFFQPGERVQNCVAGSPWAQVVRNAVFGACQRD